MLLLPRLPRRCGLLIVLAGAFPAMAEDATHPTVNGGDRDHGWYVAGKGADLRPAVGHPVDRRGQRH